jgi:hypothetical protein
MLSLYSNILLLYSKIQCLKRWYHILYSVECNIRYTALISALWQVTCATVQHYALLRLKRWYRMLNNAARYTV